MYKWFCNGELVQLAKLGKGTKNKVAEWPLKAEITTTRGPLAKTVRA